MFREAARDRRARRAARLFPRAERMPRLALGLGRRRARRPDGAHRLPRRPHPDPQGAEPRARRIRQGPRWRHWSMSATRWKRRSTISRPAAGELGLRGMPAFVFQEGHDPVAEQAFREIARLTRGAYCRFDLSAPRTNSPNCCARRRSMRPAASRRSPTFRRGAARARRSCSRR